MNTIRRKDGAIVGKNGDIVAVAHDETIRQRIASDVKFRHALLREAMDCLIEGDLGTTKLHLRDLIAGSIGYETLSARTKIPNKSLIRMFGPSGNPRADNLLAVLSALQRAEGIRLQTTIQKAPVQRKAS